MWEIIGVLVCLGSAQTPSPNCLLMDDTFGPYKTKQLCEVRAAQLSRELPSIVAQGMGFVGVVKMTPIVCTRASDADA